MSRSSIFNFESFEGFAPRFPWALLGVAAVVGLVESATRLTPNDALMPAQSSWGQVRYLETAVIAPATHPRVVVLGSSRMRDAVAPRVFEQALGEPEGSVVNAAMGGGRLFDALDVYERNRAKLKGAAVVIGLDDWHFSLGAYPLGTLYELHAPLADRFALPEPPRNALVLDGLFQMRLKLPIAFELLPRRLSGRQEVSTWTLDSGGQVRNTEDQTRIEEDFARNAAQLAAMHYAGFRQSAVLAGHLERLTELAKEDGARVLLVDLPNRSEYRHEVRQHYQAEHAAFVRWEEAEAAKLQVPLLRYEAPEDCGLSDGLYQDYGHLLPEGARRFSLFLEKQLRGMGLGK